MMLYMRVRMSGLVAAWTLTLAAATTVSWAGVDLVGAEVSPSGPAALSQAEVQRRIHALTGPDLPAPASASASATATDPSASPAPGTLAAGTTPDRRSIVTRGGTAVLSCAGDRLTVRASPVPGYGLDEDTERAGSRSVIIFSDGRHAWRIEATCAATALTARVTEGRPTGDD